MIFAADVAVFGLWCRAGLKLFAGGTSVFSANGTLIIGADGTSGLQCRADLGLFAGGTSVFSANGTLVFGANGTSDLQCQAGLELFVGGTPVFSANVTLGFEYRSESGLSADSTSGFLDPVVHRSSVPMVHWALSADRSRA